MKAIVHLRNFSAFKAVVSFDKQLNLYKLVQSNGVIDYAPASSILLLVNAQKSTSKRKTSSRKRKK